MDKRFIEESFPVKEISEESAREKNIRKGNISALHLWWARRPLASSRATNYASLIKGSDDEIDWVKKMNFIIELSKWENSLNENILERARNEIYVSQNKTTPKILDPFSGGGAIPLEALRLGCETYANDYNPVAVLIEKCTLEFPQKFSKSKKTNWHENKNFLVEDVKKWGAWIFKEVKKDLDKFYLKEEDGSIPVGYIWARTITCQNPVCRTEIPLLRQFWLSKRKNNEIFLKPLVKHDKIEFEIYKGNGPPNFDPSKGTVSKAIANCMVCGSHIDANTTRTLFNKGESGERLIAVVLTHPKKRGKTYRLASEMDKKIFDNSKELLEEKRAKLMDEIGMDPIPQEPLPPIGTLGFRVQRYGILKWGDLFNNRQKLALITFIEKIRKAHNLMIERGLNKEYADALTTYLALILNKLVMFSSSNCTWKVDTTQVINAFVGRHALQMTMDYFEMVPISGVSASWPNLLNVMESSLNVLKNLNSPATVTQASATSLPYPNDYFDAVFTDPPYYDNIPYSYLSDFFYVWLKRTIGDIYPELLSTPLTPKSKEIVAYTHEKTWDQAKEFFEDMLSKSFKEIERVLKPDGIATIVYAHKTTEGWETVINALLDSGLNVTASWPISTEMKGRLRAQNSAALASSIYIVARKLEKTDLGWYKDVKEELRRYIPAKLNELWEAGVSGADFYISAIGSAIEVFGKYKKILDNEGNEIRAEKLLSFVRDLVSDYTVRQILHDGIADELSPLTKFYLMWRWNYQEARVPFDDARKLAQSAGIDLPNEWNKGFIVKRGEFITIQGPDKRDNKSLEDSRELIDVVHHICLLWKEGKQDEMKSVLKESGYGEGESLYKVAQAISETLPNSSSEKKMIEGFLAGRDKIMQDMREDDSQTKLV